MGEAVAEAASSLERAGVAEARREAERLAAWVLGRDRGILLAHRADPFPPAFLDRFLALVARRRRREPFEHVVGEADFFGLRFRVDSRVLVPRPETELLVKALIGLGIPEGGAVADLGTGSGAIAVTLARRRPDLRLFALDRSEGALELAASNARRHGVAGRIAFECASFASPPRSWLARMDAVASNPPYVSEAEWEGLAPEVRDHEPREALVAGPSGLESYREIAPAAFALLRPGGAVALELGHRSESGAREAVARAGFERLEVLPDWQGISRVLLARKPGTTA